MTKGMQRHVPLQGSGGYQMRREIGPDRTPGGPPVTSAKGLMPERIESLEKDVKVCGAAGAHGLAAIDVTAGATAMAWPHPDATELTEGVSPVGCDACAA